MPPRPVLAVHVSAVMRLLVLLGPERAARGTLAEGPRDAPRWGEVLPHALPQPARGPAKATPRVRTELGARAAAGAELGVAAAVGLGPGGTARLAGPGGVPEEWRLFDPVRAGSTSSVVRPDGAVETLVRASSAITLASPLATALWKGAGLAKVSPDDYVDPPPPRWRVPCQRRRGQRGRVWRGGGRLRGGRGPLLAGQRQPPALRVLDASGTWLRLEHEPQRQRFGRRAGPSLPQGILGRR
ncbi:unnamed protein product [Prorocentrum cordatum]|uniref:Uncharacterized protein n=1 Tax=Prorocentrum cordatum TaxID=2364126 RepID=A0ABN9XYQ2_9DINO|nr:unnamed protein product [Polarella glacialis]